MEIQHFWKTYVSHCLIMKDFTIDELMSPDISGKSSSRNRNEKSPGHDEIHAEALRLTDTKLVTDLFNKIYKLTFRDVHVATPLVE